MPERSPSLPPWRNLVWGALRADAGAGRGHTATELTRLAHGAPKEVRQYLHALLAAGYARLVEPEPVAGRRPPTQRWTLARDPGPAAPWLQADGSAKRECAKDRLWRTARMLRTFTATDLALHASIPGAAVTEQAARRFAQALARADLATLVHSGTMVRCWRLKGMPGAVPPLMQAGGVVLDRNTGRSAGAFRGRTAHG